MSILKSNNANFQITVEWLQQRGYKLWYRHLVDNEVVMLDYPATKTQRPFYATKGSLLHKEKIELHWIVDNDGLGSDFILSALIGVFYRGPHQRRLVFRPDQVNKLIALEEMWDKKREV